MRTRRGRSGHASRRLSEGYGRVTQREVAGRGRQSLRARATDADNPQSEVPRWNRLGHRNNAVEVVSVNVH